MKNIFLIILSFLLALVIGCQDNMINEPADVLLKGDQKNTSISPATTSNTIKLNYDLVDPTFGSCKLDGRVTYSHQVLDFEGSMTPVGLRKIDLKIFINSTLDDITGMLHLEWRIEDKSEDVLYLNEEGIFLLEKSYWISYRDDVVLLVQYLVTTDGIGISKVSLAQIEK